MKEVIDFSDFLKLELRVGKIVKGEVPEWSHKLLHFTVDFGTEIGERSILSGVREWYSPEDFVGKQFGFVVNLEPRKMGESVSEGMMLMVDGQEKPFPIAMPDEAQPGDIIR